jgi:hypothetical protein
MNVDDAIQRICATTTNTLTPAQWNQYISPELPYQLPMICQPLMGCLGPHPRLGPGQLRASSKGTSTKLIARRQRRPAPSPSPNWPLPLWRTGRRVELGDGTARVAGISPGPTHVDLTEPGDVECPTVYLAIAGLTLAPAIVAPAQPSDPWVRAPSPR